MNKHVVERDGIAVLQAGQDHSSHPQRDNVARRNQQVGRIELRQFRRRVRPAHCGVRPQGGREPRIQNVLILYERMTRHGVGVKRSFLNANPPLVVGVVVLPDNVFSTGERGFQLFLRAVLAVPDRDLVSPPQLTSDGPVARDTQTNCIVLAVLGGGVVDRAQQRHVETTRSTETIDTQRVVATVVIGPFAMIDHTRR